MRKTIAIFALALLLLFAGCDYFGVSLDPGSADPEVGGGQLDPYAEEAGGGQVPVGGGARDDAGAAEDAAAAEDALAQFAGETILLPAMTPGDSYQRGALTFTLEQVRIESSQLVVHYALSGLASDTAPTRYEPRVQLAKGALLAPTGGAGGGGRPPGESNRYTFPPLPPGTVQFDLLLANQWTGSPETWQVPVMLKQLQ